MDELHHLIETQQWEKVRSILSPMVKADDLVKRWYPEDFNVFDSACSSGAPLDVLTSVHRIDPYQVRGWNMEEDCSVLHTACVFSSIDAVVFILDVAPEISNWSDRLGRLPLHEISRSPTIVRKLLSVHPTAVYATDARGESPTHRFLREDQRWHVDEAGREVLSLLLKAFAYGTTYDDDAPTFPRCDDKWILLHELIKRSDIPLCVTLRLMKEAPEYLLLQDDEGNFPLHIAAKFKGGRGGNFINRVAWSL